MKLEEGKEGYQPDFITEKVKNDERLYRLSGLMRWKPHPLTVAHVLQAPATTGANGNLHAVILQRYLGPGRVP